MARRADARRNHTLLVLAAKEVFAEQGSGAPMEAVARRAGVGNATMYRHFANRHDLVIAVHADETAALCSAQPTGPARDALFGWLRRLVAYLATKRDIALALTDPNRPQSTLFDRWHDTVSSTLATLLDATTVRPGLTATDLLLLAAGIALTGTDPARHDRLLGVVRDGARLMPTGATPVRSAAWSSPRSGRRPPGAAPAGPSAGRSG
ncbi:MAG TPA: helix-turn-helix domain-containing protein [Pseudonocardiaceae bacterium]